MGEQARARWASVGATLAGLAAPDERYRDVVGPERLEGRGLSDAMMRMWSCALTWCGLARMMGVIDGAARLAKPIPVPELGRAYEIGHAMSDAVAVARRLGAWRDYAPGVGLPRLGDAVIIGPGGYHCRGCLVQIHDEGTIDCTIDFVEGGHQNAAGHMSIERVNGLRLIELGGALYCGTSAGASTRVYGWIDVAALPEGDVVAERAEDAAPAEEAPT